MIRPFEDKFGHAIERIQRLEDIIQKDALLMMALQKSSLARHEVDSLLQRRHVEGVLSSKSELHFPSVNT